MKQIMLNVGLILLALLGVIVIVVVIMDVIRKKKSESSKDYGPVSPMPDYHQYHQGTVLMDSSSNEPQVQPATICRGRLRHYGSGDWPGEILLSLAVGSVFTIGRFDVTVGHPVCDFEFDARSKAVSRRHAEIACDAEGFLIRDLNSKAGTIVNGVVLERNTYYRIMNGFHVSFGNAGADYIWMQD